MLYSRRFFFMGLLLLGLYTFPVQLSAQERTFTHLTTDDGLPSNIIGAVLQDHRGYLWFGTWFGAGLARYDGYEMKVFRPVPGDSTSLASGTIRDLLETKDGTLWIGAGGGLSRFDAATETFKTYRHIEGNPNSLSSTSVISLYETEDGTLWVGTNDGGLNRFDRETESFKSYQPVEGDPTSLGDDDVHALLQTADGTLWAGTDNGLSRFDPSASSGETPATETFRTYRHIEGDPTSLSHNQIRDLYQTDDGTLWVGTWGGGLNRFDPIEPGTGPTETFKTYRHIEGDPTSLSQDQIWQIIEAEEGMLWLGTWGGGVNRFDPVTETFKSYRPVPSDPTSLSHTQVTSLKQADDGTLWLGTWGGGINGFDAASETFELYRNVPGDPISLPGDQVWSLLENDDGTLWLGIWGGGLNHFDPEQGLLKTYRRSETIGNESPNNVISIIETRDGSIWYGTAGGGLTRFDPSTETSRTYQPIEDDPTSLSDDWIHTLYETDDGTLWIGTAEGLNRFDRETETFKTYLHIEGDLTSLAGNDVGSLLQTGDGALWIGTSEGLSHFDPETEIFKKYRHVEGDPTSLSDDAINALFQDDDGTLWVGTNNGLNRLDIDPADPASVSFSRFLVDADIQIESILEDEQGQLWLGLTNGRLVRFNPETGQTRSFGKRYGLPTGTFLQSLRSRDGTLYWSNSSGLVSLDLDRLPPPGTPPRVHMSEVLLFDEPLTPGPDSPLKQALWQTEALQLNHNQNDLTFGYVGLHYAEPEENRYQYRLLGYDQDWRNETKQRRATYTNLPPGTYTFEVNAANSDGIWTEEPARLEVEILPPWWRTTWAYVLYGLLFIGALVTADRIQRRRLIARERERTRTRELEQAREIEKAHTELQKTHAHLQATQAQLVQQEKMASLGELTAGIAHEIKNPLNFVNNFAELIGELVDELGDELHTDLGDSGAEKPHQLFEILANLKTNAKQIAKHGRRADGIVSAMMQHASGGMGQREPTDVNALLEEYVNLAYHGKRAQIEGFNCEIERDYDEAVGSVEMIPQDMGRVFLNLLSNAFDAVSEQDQPTVRVQTQRADHAIEIRVTDNGPGIPKDFISKIFDPFFTTKPTGSGTGLGLSLSYDIVTQGHGGTLTVESEEGKGATFIITLPTSL